MAPAPNGRGKNYVRVGVRVRPPFEDELGDDADAGGAGGWVPAVSVASDGPGASAAVARLELDATRAREFAYDHAFGPETSQAEVFDTLAAPVVDAVLERGANGTVFASPPASLFSGRVSSPRGRI